MERIISFLISYRPYILGMLIVLSGLSILGFSKLKFTFDFEQLFAQGDPDLAFFQQFVKDFESDDSFLLIGLVAPRTVWDSSYLRDVSALTREARGWDYVRSAQSLTSVQYPLRSPFGITLVPWIHPQDPSRYTEDSLRVVQDPRLRGRLISEDGQALVLALSTEDGLDIEQSKIFMNTLRDAVSKYSWKDVHYLGRAHFQEGMVEMQERELKFSTIVSLLLVALILWLIFRRIIPVAIALASVGMGLILFLGYLALAGRELNILSALYPLLMVIVGTSDVVHMLSKYIDELDRGQERWPAITTTVRQIGLATLFTSLTTGIGYASLVTSRIGPVQDFGWNAAIGVMIAYAVVIFGTTIALSYFPLERLVQGSSYSLRWTDLMERYYHWSYRHQRQIIYASIGIFILSLIGVAQVSTDFKLVDNLPRGEKITEDYNYFEEQLSGFRPMEIAVWATDGGPVNRYEILSEINILENYLAERPEINSVQSYTDLYRSLHRAHSGNRAEAFIFPPDSLSFTKYQRQIERFSPRMTDRLISQDGRSLRISTRLADIGADQIRYAGEEIDAWIDQHIDTSRLQMRRTGTGLILDKNSEYVQRSILYGLGLAIGIVALLMVLLFQDLRLLIISIIPNLLPLLMTAAALGYLGIELEAGVSIVFAISFGIAVDDTIHYLSKYQLLRRRGASVEEAIHRTTVETGKAILLTTVILFFGFLILLFSIHPPSRTVGVLISITLVSALVADLALIPILIRWLSPGRS